MISPSPSVKVATMSGVQPCTLGGIPHQHHDYSRADVAGLWSEIKRGVECQVKNGFLGEGMFSPGRHNTHILAVEDSEDEESGDICYYRPRTEVNPQDVNDLYVCPGFLSGICVRYFFNGEPLAYKRAGFWSYEDWVYHLLLDHGFLKMALQKAGPPELLGAVQYLIDIGEMKSKPNVEFSYTPYFEQIVFKTPLHPEVLPSEDAKDRRLLTLELKYKYFGKYFKQ